MVVLVYVAVTVAIAVTSRWYVDRAMTIAINISNGQLDIGYHPTWNDTVTVGGRTYHVVGLLPIVPYLAFVPLPALWEAARLIISTGLGILAGWLCLVLARRYGASGATTYWIAALGAFGTLLFTLAVQGNFYYLAHVQAMLLTLLALIEWQGRRRPWVMGLALGLAALARPTVLLAVIPFGVAILLDRERPRLRQAVEFGVYVGITVVIAGVYNAVRFGSPFETGYDISVLVRDVFADKREIGLFSLRHLPDNLGLLVARGFDFRGQFPYLVPYPHGHSILLTSPALLMAVGAGIRDRTTQLLWAAASIITVPLLLYYGGGGYATYGYRYFLDVVPFLLALVAIASARRFGALDRMLIVMSIAFTSYGIVWVLFE